MKSALVMGASGDIGEAVCRELAAKGWSLYLHFHKNEKKVLNFLSVLQNCYPQQSFFMVSLDMLDCGKIPPFLDELFQVDAVIFAAGFTKYGLLSEHTADEINDLWQVHLGTPLLLLQGLEEKLRRSQHSRIIFIGSVYGLSGSSLETVYSAVKGAQQSFVKAYAQEVASLGITVNCVAPGAVATQMNDSLTEDELNDLKNTIPLGRLATTREIATAVAYLCSENAQYITGVTLPITGGWLY